MANLNPISRLFSEVIKKYLMNAPLPTGGVKKDSRRHDYVTKVSEAIEVLTTDVTPYLQTI